MNKNPYRVLGVSPDASDEEIKQAYRALARKYHPDRHKDNDLADLASEKMKEINAAYEEIQHARAEAADRASGVGRSTADAARHREGASQERRQYYSTDETGSYNRQNYSEEAQEKFVLIRNCINAGNVTEAQRLLSEIEDEDRGAEWHFLWGCVLLRRGAYVDAQREFDTAYRMEPTNNEYFRFKEQMHERANGFGGEYRTSRVGGCDCCTSLLCADCCCECMGGDLIPCC